MSAMLRPASVAALLTLATVGCKKDAAKPPSAAPQAAPAPVAPLAGAVPYPFTQADSRLTWVGAKVTGRHEGSFGAFGGIIELVGEDPTRSRVRAEVSMGTLISSPEKLVAHLKGPDFFDVEAWPTASFVSSAIARTGEGYAVTGDLTLHGNTRTITFPASITASGPEVTVDADLKLNRKDFGVVYPGAPDDLIADEVVIKLELHAKKRF